VFYNRVGINSDITKLFFVSISFYFANCMKLTSIQKCVVHGVVARELPLRSESHGDIVITPTSHSGRPRFESRVHKPAIVTEMFQWFFSGLPCKVNALNRSLPYTSVHFHTLPYTSVSFKSLISRHHNIRRSKT
jgi:hypothetical protein